MDPAHLPGPFGRRSLNRGSAPTPLSAKRWTVHPADVGRPTPGTRRGSQRPSLRGRPCGHHPRIERRSALGAEADAPPRRRLTIELKPELYTRLRMHAARRTEVMGFVVPLRDVIEDALALVHGVGVDDEAVSSTKSSGSCARRPHPRGAGPIPISEGLTIPAAPPSDRPWSLAKPECS